MKAAPAVKGNEQKEGVENAQVITNGKKEEGESRAEALEEWIKSEKELRETSPPLVQALRRRWKQGVDLRVIQKDPSLAVYMITQDDIIRTSKGEGCKKV